jgi:NAD(P)-dependent dehydrogenase (short-subunit alcohol dehydrogenase family)
MGTLDGKVAIVTGAGKGIGQAEAVALAKEGASVMICDCAAYDETLAQLTAIRGADGAAGMNCDVRKSADVAAVVAEAVRRFGDIDILVNNAQKLSMPHDFEDWTEAEMREQWESGALGSWLFMQSCFPHMRKKGGRIINTSSSAGYAGYPGYSGYGAAKEAIRSITRSAAKEWGKFNITVNCISPAALTSGAAGAMDAEAEAGLVAAFALGRWGDPYKDIARVVVFLAGPDASFMTGNTVSADGGLAMLV